MFARAATMRMTMAAGVVLLIAGGVSADVTVYRDGVDIQMINAENSTSPNPDTGNVFLQVGRVPIGPIYRYQALIDFPGIFGAGPAQVPFGSTIGSATLYLYSTGPRSGTNQDRALYEMTVPWDQTTTWINIDGDSSIASNLTGGVKAGENTQPTPLATWSASSAPVGWMDFDVTRSVQAWSGGAGQYGWGLWANPTVGTDFGSPSAFYSLNHPNEALRPRLEIVYVPEPASVSLALCGLAAASGLLRRRTRRH